MLSSYYESRNVSVKFRGGHSNEKLRVSISIAISEANYLLRLYSVSHSLPNPVFL